MADEDNQEFKFAKPFAEGLVNNLEFRKWVLKRTEKFAKYADEAQLLDRKMFDERSDDAKTWWYHHFQEKCRCFGCSGHETDILAVFEIERAIFETGDKLLERDTRFAIHVEVKHPGDNFKDDKDKHQAERYTFRPECWVKKKPTHVLAHADATTVLLCSETRLNDYDPDRHFFGAR
jgi:hypothetical protein